MQLFIEAWSDIACPFCFIGKKNLDDALKELSFSVPVVWRSFELDPNAPKQSNMPLTEKLASKYGRPLEWAVQMNQDITERAKSVGLDFHLEKVVLANTFDAHRMIHLAEAKGMQGAMKERLLSAYFQEGLTLSDHATLITLGKEIGLDPNECGVMLSSDQYREDVRNDEKLASELEISGVPFFVVNQRYAISGAQPKEFFVETLGKIKIELDQEEA